MDNVEKAIFSVLGIMVPIVMFIVVVIQGSVELSDASAVVAGAIVAAIIGLFVWGFRGFFERGEPHVDAGGLGKVIVEGLGEKAKRDARREELKAWVERHSEDLIVNVLRRWGMDSGEISISSNGISWNTSIGVATYIPHCASRKHVCDTPKEPADDVQCAKEHISGFYQEVWSMWIDAKTKTTTHLDSVIKCWNQNEENLISRAGKDCTTLSEWDGRGNAPSDCYWLDACFYYVWTEAARLATITTGEEPSRLEIKQDESDLRLWRLGVGMLHARSSSKTTVEDFRILLEALAKDVVQDVRDLMVLKVDVNKPFLTFRKSLDKIEQQFYKEYTYLNGSCHRCKGWLDELPVLGV